MLEPAACVLGAQCPAVLASLLDVASAVTQKLREGAGAGAAATGPPPSAPRSWLPTTTDTATFSPAGVPLALSVILGVVDLPLAPAFRCMSCTLSARYGGSGFWGGMPRGILLGVTGVAQLHSAWVWMSCTLPADTVRVFRLLRSKV